MELKLENGRYVMDAGGVPAKVRGTEELLQRARMRLAAKRGSFWPDPEYGSRLYLLGKLKPSQRAAAARQYAAEALKPETELRLGTVTYREGTDGHAAVTVEVIAGEAARELSVNIEV